MKPSRGVTLVELMASVAISSILGAVFAGSAYWQVSFWYARSDEIDARQVGEAVLHELEGRGRATAFGFVFDDAAAGYAPIGLCAAANTMTTYASTGTPLIACTGGPNGDRLRLAYGSAWGYGWTESLGSSASTVSGCNQAANWWSVKENADTPNMPRDRQFSWYFMSGSCIGSAPVAVTNDVLYTAAETASSDPQCPYVVIGNSPTNPDRFGACTSGMNAGFRMLYANIFSYYTTPALPDGTLPTLWREQRNEQVVSTAPIAYGVENFEVRYGIDTSTPLDGRLDPCPSCTSDPFGTDDGGPFSWCREAKAPDQGGSCQLKDSNGTALSTAQLLNRIVSLYVTFTVRGNRQYKTTATNPDPYRRWPFATTVNLRARAMGT